MALGDHFHCIQTILADVFFLEIPDIFGIAAEDTGWFIFLEDDPLPVDVNL
jgi:hypothetical protein